MSSFLRHLMEKVHHPLTAPCLRRAPRHNDTAAVSCHSVLTGHQAGNVPRKSHVPCANVSNQSIHGLSSTYMVAGTEKAISAGAACSYPLGASKPLRVSGEALSLFHLSDDSEIDEMIEFIRKQTGAGQYDEAVVQRPSGKCEQHQFSLRRAEPSPAARPSDMDGPLRADVRQGNFPKLKITTTKNATSIKLPTCRHAVAARC